MVEPSQSWNRQA